MSSLLDTLPGILGGIIIFLLICSHRYAYTLGRSKGLDEAMSILRGDSRHGVSRD